MCKAKYDTNSLRSNTFQEWLFSLFFLLLTIISSDLSEQLPGTSFNFTLFVTLFSPSVIVFVLGFSIIRILVSWRFSFVSADIKTKKKSCDDPLRRVCHPYPDLPPFSSFLITSNSSSKFPRRTRKDKMIVSRKQRDVRRKVAVAGHLRIIHLSFLVSRAITMMSLAFLPWVILSQ